ncbi:hypothetical protein CEXT_272981 [Caerostris extrusa]|uniref:Uncharacterized protein n=1 Tax=Caerostris extrusa TaxID=172846 RepID=A0AAV4U9I1_CAEEX|nr:hypothetical protein CEXT_272981 [Caerostris extrusa]
MRQINKWNIGLHFPLEGKNSRLWKLLKLMELLKGSFPSSSRETSLFHELLYGEEGGRGDVGGNDHPPSLKMKEKEVRRNRKHVIRDFFAATMC